MRVQLSKGNSPTLTYVTVGPLELAFSYSTIVAFYDKGWVLSENIWSVTTGKHLNEIASPSSRIPHEEFTEQLNAILGRLDVVSA